MSNDYPDDIYLFPDDLTPHKQPSAVYTWSPLPSPFGQTKQKDLSSSHVILGTTERPPERMTLEQFNTAKATVLLCERIIKTGIYKSFNRTNKGPAFRVKNQNTGKIEMLYLHGITEILRTSFYPDARFYGLSLDTEHIPGMLQKFKYVDDESGETIEEEVFNFAQAGDSSKIGHVEIGSTKSNFKSDEGVWYVAVDDMNDSLSLHEKTHLDGSSSGSADSMERGRQVHAIMDWYQKSYIQELKRGTSLTEMPAILKREIDEFVAKNDFDIRNIEMAIKIIDVYNLPELQIIPICSELPVFVHSRLKAHMKRRKARPSEILERNALESLHGTFIDALGFSVALNCLVGIEIKTTKADITKSTFYMKPPLKSMRDSFLNQTIVQLDVETEQFLQTYMEELVKAGISPNVYSLGIFSSPFASVAAEWTLQTPKEREIIVSKLKRSKFSFLVK